MYRKLYTKHNSLKFTDSVKLNTAKCMFKARSHSLPPHLQNLFKVKVYDNILFHRIRIKPNENFVIYLVQGHSCGTI